MGVGGVWGGVDTAAPQMWISTLLLANHNLGNNRASGASGVSQAQTFMQTFA